ncbi:MAG: PAS domain S-box protein [Methylophilus sp.]|nr:PAS domain S-box protein [Methylophilus sp.]
MLSSIVNKLANQTAGVQQLNEEAAEFRALKTEIDKARCVIEFDANGNILSANSNAQKALGYTEKELLNQPHQFLMAATEANKQKDKTLWSDLAEGKSQSDTFCFKGKSGENVWMLGYFAPALSKTNKLSKVYSFFTDVTAEKTVQLDLEATQTAFDIVFNSYELSLDGTILSVNDTVLSTLGYQAGELIGKNSSILLTKEEYSSEAYQTHWANVKKGIPQKGQIKRLTKDGREQWFSAAYAPIFDEFGKVAKVRVISTCINEEKKEAINYLGQLQAISKIQGVIEFDLKGNILAVNDNFINVTGYSEKEIVGNHHSMFVDATYKASKEYKEFWEKLARGDAEEGIFKRIGKNGAEVWLQASYNPILGLDGKPFKVVKYATDITKVQQKAADFSGQLSAIDKVMGIIEFDLKGNITAVNNNFATATGYSQQEIVGNHHSMFVDAAYKASPEYKAFWDKLGRGEADVGQYKRIGKGGKEVWLQASYNPILDASGKPSKVVKYATDITEQHKASTALDAAVEETQHVIESAKLGDLTSRVPLEGKSGAIASLCDGVNALMDKMTEVLLSVREAGETINTAAGEISTGNNDLSQRTEQQASSLEETASSMEQLSSTVKQNAENAKQANQLAAAASGVAVKGGEVVGNVVTTMSAINASARKIEDIISVIDGIAFQTNILALNAAVEAARAGEQGRGFAVVAGEVRNLAQRSASAAKEIKELISDSVSKVQEGTQLVENAGTTMAEIVSSVQRVTDIMGEISAASSEQSAGIDQVNTAITSMDEVTQQNAALVEEAAAAAESLVDQAISLMEVVGNFKLKGAGVQQERRASNSPMRASKPAAITKSVSTPKPSAPPVATKVSAKTGTDDGDWEEF